MVGVAVPVFLSLLVIGGASKVDDVVNRTERVVGALQKESSAAEKRFGTDKLSSELDQIGQQFESDFKGDLYKKQKDAFADSAKRAAQKAQEAMSTKNVSAAEDALDDADMELKKMSKSDHELDAMEKELRHKLRDALDRKLDSALKGADKMEDELDREADHLQDAAHSALDPLYGLGRAAEEQADRFNKETDRAFDRMEDAFDKANKAVNGHAKAVQRSVEHKLFGDQDRDATWRKVHREVRTATGHVSAQQNLALPLTGGLTLLVTAAIGAAAGGLATGFVMKSRTPQCDQYQYLSA